MYTRQMHVDKTALSSCSKQRKLRAIIKFTLTLTLPLDFGEYYTGLIFQMTHYVTWYRLYTFTFYLNPRKYTEISKYILRFICVTVRLFGGPHYRKLAIIRIGLLIGTPKSRITYEIKSSRIIITGANGLFLSPAAGTCFADTLESTCTKCVCVRI